MMLFIYLFCFFNKIASEFNAARKPDVKPSHQHMKEEQAHVITNARRPTAAVGDGHLHMYRAG